MYKQESQPDIRSKRKQCAACECCAVEGLYQIYKLKPLRRTPGVMFDSIPPIPGINAMDRVIHTQGAISPGSVGDVKRPWYFHPHQDDNLVVMYGRRFVDLYTPKHGKIEHFIVEPNAIYLNGKILHEGPSILAWPVNVFHRIRSDPEGFDIATEFNVYDVDADNGTSRIIRLGKEDQPGGDLFEGRNGEGEAK